MAIKAIIPCAGYGTRLGMAPNESKEMLVDATRREHVIDYSLELCRTLGFEPLVISRSGKEDLNKYLPSIGIIPVIIDDGEEWYDTILKSYNHWGDNNVVLLPDTRWSNAVASLKHIKYSFEKLNSVMALGTLDVEDARKWCVVHGDFLFEKPNTNMSSLAVGVFGFYKEVGRRMFNNFKNKTSFEIPKTTQFVELQNFEDITRQKSTRLSRE